MIFTFAARQSSLQMFAYFVKFLVIFFCIFNSEKFEASFLFVIKLLWSWCNYGLHQMKSMMNLKQNCHHNL